MRIRCGVRARGGMKSMTRTAPSAMPQSVSSTRVLPAYRRARAPVRPRGRERPVSRLFIVQERGERGGRVETGQAEPVD